MKKIYLLTGTLCISIALMAQSPGGVAANLRLWLRADASGTLSSTDSLNSWSYFNSPSNVTPGSAVFVSQVHNRPIVQHSTFNFLPSVFFNGAQQMDGPTGNSAPIDVLPVTNPSYAIFAVWSSNLSSANPQRVWSQRSTGSGGGDGGGLWLYNGAYGDQPEISPFTQAAQQPYTHSTPMISEVDLKAQDISDVEIVDQSNIAHSPLTEDSDPANMALIDRQISALINRLGSRDVPTEEPFIGNLAELIVYNVQVDAGASRNQIFSYLGMKYGIHLGISLLSSAGATVWDASANATYNNDVFGLALDNGSGLAVSTANSSNTGMGNGAGVNRAGNMTLSEFSPITTDQSFLMIGDDGGALTETTSNMPASATGSSRLVRNWKVQNTNSVGPVNIGFDLTGLTVTGAVGTTTDFRLMVNSAGDNTFPDATTELYTASSFSGMVANFSQVTLPTGSVVGIISGASGSTPLPVNFITFTAQPDGGNVNLAWMVGDNEQASTYEIDRSSDGATFAKIGTVTNSASQKTYIYVDEKAGDGTHYYRVLETDPDGQSIFSKVVTARIGAGDFSVAVLNNPAKGSTNAQLQINAVNAGTAFIEVWSVGGQRLSLRQEAIGTGTTTISVPMSNLGAGSYVVKVMVGGNTHVTQVVKL